ncbi:MAG TPA: hypothetical protein VGL53_05540 [Bryobacteraceae bacterium]|jgi:hypothetical protein
MAKIKPAKKNASAKTIAADWSKAIPCLLILGIGFIVIVLLMYFGMSSSVK